MDKQIGEQQGQTGLANLICRETVILDDQRNHKRDKYRKVEAVQYTESGPHFGFVLNFAVMRSDSLGEQENQSVYCKGEVLQRSYMLKSWNDGFVPNIHY